MINADGTKCLQNIVPTCRYKSFQTFRVAVNANEHHNGDRAMLNNMG